MKTPPLCKAERPNDEGEEIGYLTILDYKYYILALDAEEIDDAYEIIPDTLKIKCSDGKFRPIGEVEIVESYETMLQKHTDKIGAILSKDNTMMKLCDCGKMTPIGYQCINPLNGKCKI